MGYPSSIHNNNHTRFATLSDLIGLPSVRQRIDLPNGVYKVWLSLVVTREQPPLLWLRP